MRDEKQQADGVFAIVPAAGDGVRLGAKTRKAGVMVAGKPLVVWTLAALRNCPELCGGVLVVHPADLEGARREWLPAAGLEAETWEVVAGGATREASVRAGLHRVQAGAGWILVHDAARPLLDRADLIAVVAEASRTGAAILVSMVADTLKRGRDGIIAESVERAGLFCAETPQVFRRDLFERAYAWAGGARGATDDAELVQRLGTRVSLVEGRSANLKVTCPKDLALISRYLSCAI